MLVFLKRGHGADAAKVSRPVFEEFTRWKDQIGPSRQANAAKASTEPGRLARIRSWAAGLWSTVDSNPASNAHEGKPANVLPSSASGNSSATDFGRKVLVHQVRENVTREMPLEDYVATVVATEGSMEDEPEALKALAVAVRTYALKNLGRHSKDGYDFCTTTHCQRYDPAFQSESAGARALAAVQMTAGEVLRDQRASLVDSYFSASCGGMTANVEHLWGGPGSTYLRGVRDESCSGMPHHNWTDVIASDQLLQALRSDERTNPGASLNEVIITRRDATGRAELITIEGERRHVVRGWDFKIIVGRKLGWNLLKSSRFEVSRSGTNFVFRGTGFGHGLGLCQEGAHVMAQRGANYEQILGKYFPGTDVGHESKGLAANMAGRARAFADLLWNDRSAAVLTLPVYSATDKRITLSSEHFRVSYPANLSQRDVAEILRTLEATRANLLQKVSAAGLAVNQFPAREVFVNATTGDFVGRTGQPWWAAAVTTDNRIELQPVEVLKRRGILNTTLKHEVVHTLIDKLSRGKAPRWLAEGMALYFAGEGPMVSRYGSTSKTSVAEIDASLTRATTADEMRKAYAAAYREVSSLAKTGGEAGLWQRVARN